MSKTEVVVMSVDPKQYGLEESKAQQMTSGLAPVVAEREMLAKQFEDVIQMELGPAAYKAARELRVRIKDNRTKGILPWHKVNKEFYLRGGQFVDAIKNKEIDVNEKMESRLEEIEKHEERMEAERKAALRVERVEALKPFDVDVNFVTVEDMTEEVWRNYYQGCKMSYEKRVEDARIAEEQRQAEIKAEQARIEAQRLENERLKKEAEEREKQLEAERKAAQDAIAAEQAKAKAIEDAARIERQKAEAAAEAERKRVQEELAAKQAEADRIARELAAEKQRKADEERKAAEAEEARLSAGDAEKWEMLKSDISKLIGKYEMKSAANKKKSASVDELFNKVLAFIG